MRQLNLLIKNCSECPYHRFTEDNDYMYPLCYFREKTPFALTLSKYDDAGSRVLVAIDEKCELPEYFDIDEPLIAGLDVYNSSSGLVRAVRGVPEDWLRDMNEVEREEFNRQEDARIERLLRKQGFDVPSSHGVEYDEKDGD